jgi:hypothetical protein
MDIAPVKLAGHHVAPPSDVCLANAEMGGWPPDGSQTSREVRKVPLLSHLEYVQGEAIGVNLAIHIGPKAVHPIALDTFDSHQWSA